MRHWIGGNRKTSFPVKIIELPALVRSAGNVGMNPRFGPLEKNHQLDGFSWGRSISHLLRTSKFSYFTVRCLANLAVGKVCEHWPVVACTDELAPDFWSPFGALANLEFVFVQPRRVRFCRLPFRG